MPTPTLASVRIPQAFPHAVHTFVLIGTFTTTLVRSIRLVETTIGLLDPALTVALQVTFQFNDDRLRYVELVDVRAQIFHAENLERGHLRLDRLTFEQIRITASVATFDACARRKIHHVRFGVRASVHLHGNGGRLRRAAGSVSEGGGQRTFPHDGRHEAMIATRLDGVPGIRGFDDVAIEEIHRICDVP